MPLLPETKKTKALGSRERPWENLFLLDAQGNTVSLKDALQGMSDNGGGFFKRSQNGQEIVFDPEGVVTPPPVGQGTSDYWVNPYTGNDQPGSGNNTLKNGQARQWTTLANKTYILVRTSGGVYRMVELTNWDT
jgi:hypothetical protein